MSSNSGAGNLIASFSQNDLRIMPTMTIASFDVLLEQVINLIYTQGMHYNTTADAIKMMIPLNLETSVEVDNSKRLKNSCPRFPTL